MRFYFSLAETLGYTVADLLNNISSEELSYWIAYYRLKQKEEEAELKKAQRKRG
jgi:citrate synthase